jgi:hypothetical protein
MALRVQAGGVQPDHGVHAVVRGGRARLQQLPGHASWPEAHLLCAGGGLCYALEQFRSTPDVEQTPFTRLLPSMQVSVLKLDFLALALVAVLTAILCYGTKASAWHPCSVQQCREACKLQHSVPTDQSTSPTV